MGKVVEVEEKILSAIRGLPEDKLVEIVDYAGYLKVKEILKGKDIESFDKWAEKIAKKRKFNKLTYNEVAETVLTYRRKID